MMANTNFFTQSVTCLALGTFGRCPASNVDHPIRLLRSNSKIKHPLRFQNDTSRKMDMAVYAGITPGDPIDPSPGSWKFWIIGTIFTILLSFTRGKWGPLLRLKEKVETTLDEAQRVVDIIEDAAEGVDKMAEEAVKHLPDGKLRDAVQYVEKFAEDIDKKAERAEDVLEKVENMENELESFIESTTHKKNPVTTTTEGKEQK